MPFSTARSRWRGGSDATLANMLIAMAEENWTQASRRGEATDAILKRDSHGAWARRNYLPLTAYAKARSGDIAGG